MPDARAPDAATCLGEIIRNRHSERGPYDASQAVEAADLDAILEAGRWAPTAHNMQNYEIVVIDDPSTLAAVGRLQPGGSGDFLKENYAQLSFSEEELIRKGTGLLATMFPPSWRTPDAEPDTSGEPATLEATMRSCPVVLIVLYDPRRRAPASEGDVLIAGAAVNQLGLVDILDADRSDLGPHFGSPALYDRNQQVDNGLTRLANLGVVVALGYIK